VEEAFRRGTTPDAVAELLYDECLVVVSDDAPVAVRGLSAYMPEMKSVMDQWGPRPRLKYSIAEPQLLAESIAVILSEVEVQLDTVPKAVERYRVLMGWTKGHRGWRVALQMYAVGSL
jgi:hypothetical protein